MLVEKMLRMLRAEMSSSGRKMVFIYTYVVYDARDPRDHEKP